MSDVVLIDSIEIRRALIATARQMNVLRINVNKSGNVSVRITSECGREGFLITPTGIPYEALEPADLVFIPMFARDLSSAVGLRKASSEWALHSRIYEKKASVRAIVHTHSVYATAMACQEKPIPAFHYMVATAGGKEIPCAPYCTFGTDELADSAAIALAEHKACLLAHHGVVATGKDLDDALRMAVEVENLAQCYCIARSLGEVPLLSNEEMALNIEKFKTYGVQK